MRHKYKRMVTGLRLPACTWDSGVNNAIAFSAERLERKPPASYREFGVFLKLFRAHPCLQLRQPLETAC